MEKYKVMRTLRKKSESEVLVVERDNELFILKLISSDNSEQSFDEEQLNEV